MLSVKQHDFRVMILDLRIISRVFTGLKILKAGERSRGVDLGIVITFGERREGKKKPVNHSVYGGYSGEQVVNSITRVVRTLFSHHTRLNLWKTTHLFTFVKSAVYGLMLISQDEFA